MSVRTYKKTEVSDKYKNMSKTDAILQIFKENKPCMSVREIAVELYDLSPYVPVSDIGFNPEKFFLQWPDMKNSLNWSESYHAQIIRHNKALASILKRVPGVKKAMTKHGYWKLERKDYHTQKRRKYMEKHYGTEVG